MKTFRYERGHVAGSTMTVKELRLALSEFPDDMPVMAEWEGCHAYIERDKLVVATVGKGCAADECEALVIDVNGY